MVNFVFCITCQPCDNHMTRPSRKGMCLKVCVSITHFGHYWLVITGWAKGLKGRREVLLFWPVEVRTELKNPSMHGNQIKLQRVLQGWWSQCRKQVSDRGPGEVVVRQWACLFGSAGVLRWGSGLGRGRFLNRALTVDHGGLEVGMSTGVLDEVVTAHETLVAEGTQEALLARVGAKVSGQLVRTGELLFAVRPSARKRPLT